MTSRMVYIGMMAAFLAFPSVVVSQGPPAGVSITGAAGFHTLTGDDFEDTDAGVGVQGVLRYTTVGGFSIGGGVQYNIHGVDGFDENFNVLGIYVEPRYIARLQASGVAPFIGGRVAWVKESMSVPGATVKATGYGLGGIGGILFQLAPQVDLETAVTFTTLQFGDASINNVTVDGTDSSGSSLGLQLGLVISFPQS